MLIIQIYYYGSQLDVYLNFKQFQKILILILCSCQNKVKNCWLTCHGPPNHSWTSNHFSYLFTILRMANLLEKYATLIQSISTMFWEETSFLEYSIISMSKANGSPKLSKLKVMLLVLVRNQLHKKEEERLELVIGERHREQVVVRRMVQWEETWQKNWIQKFVTRLFRLCCQQSFSKIGLSLSIQKL